MSESVFPLSLTLWEELFVVDDYDNYPANFMTRVRARGSLSRDLFLKAVSNCAQSHPLFQCVVKQQGRKWFWIKDDSQEPPVEFRNSDTEPTLPRLRKFNLAEERLWRVNFVEWRDAQGESRIDIFVEFHHAVCDGLGAIQFISDVAKEIDDLYRSHQPAADDGAMKPLRNAKVDWVALKNRGRFPQTWREFFRGLPYHYKTLMASLRLIFTKIAPLVPLDSVKTLLERQKESMGYRKIVLSTTESSSLRRVCRKQNTTVNSKVAAELFRAMSDWKIENEHPPFKALRIVMPFNERSISDSRLSACNRVSLSPFTRTVKEIADPEKLLASIENGVRLVKKGRLGINFHRGLWFCKTFFRSLKMLAKTDRVGTTGMFANVGNLHAHLGLPVSPDGVQCGPLSIFDIDLIPPVRVGTSFAMTMHEFNGQTRLGVHYDSAFISEEQAKSFFGFLEQRILKIANPDN